MSTAVNTTELRIKTNFGDKKDGKCWEDHHVVSTLIALLSSKYLSKTNYYQGLIGIFGYVSKISIPVHRKFDMQLLRKKPLSYCFIVGDFSSLKTHPYTLKNHKMHPMLVGTTCWQQGHVASELSSLSEYKHVGTSMYHICTYGKNQKLKKKVSFSCRSWKYFTLFENYNGVVFQPADREDCSACWRAGRCEACEWDCGSQGKYIPQKHFVKYMLIK